MKIMLPKEILAEPGTSFREKVQALFRHELRAHTSPHRFASSLGIGVWMGLWPHHGFQVASVIGLSMILPINRPIALLGSCISSAPMLPLIIFASVNIGSLVLHGSFHGNMHGSPLNVLATGAIEFIVGSLILGPVAGLLTYVITLPIVTIAGRRLKKGE